MLCIYILHVYFEIMISLLQNFGLPQNEGNLINKWSRLNASRFAFPAVLKLAVI